MPDDGPLPDYQGAPLDTLGVQRGPDTGPPAPVRPPHAVLLAALEGHSTTLTVLVHLVTTILDVLADHGLIPEAGRLTLDGLEAARREIRAADAIDREVGLTGRLLAEGLIEPLAAALRRSEQAHPCCGHRSEEPAR